MPRMAVCVVLCSFVQKAPPCNSGRATCAVTPAGGAARPRTSVCRFVGFTIHACGHGVRGACSARARWQHATCARPRGGGVLTGGSACAGWCQVVPRRHDEARLLRGQDGPCRWCKSEVARPVRVHIRGEPIQQQWNDRLPMHPARVPSVDEATLSRLQIVCRCGWQRAQAVSARPGRQRAQCRCSGDVCATSWCRG
jgi:hypothetical protein